MSWLARLKEDNPIRLVFPLDDLGLAAFFLSVLYFVLSVACGVRLNRIRRLSHTWNTHRIFHTFLLILAVVRTVAFGVLSFFSINTLETPKIYPILIILFMFPEFLFLSAYMLLMFNWLEVFIFSHEQYMHSFHTYDKAWKWTFILINVFMIACQGIVYVFLYIVDATKQNTFLAEIFTVLGVACLALPIVTCILWFWFSMRLSGFPFISVMAEERSGKINWVTFVWSMGRILRGIMIMLAATKELSSTIDTNILQMLVVGVTALSEFIPFMVVLDWSVIGIILLGSEDIMKSNKLDTERMNLVHITIPTHDDTYQNDKGLARISVRIQGDKQVPLNDKEDEWNLDDSEISIAKGYPVYDSGYATSTKGTWRSRAVCIKTQRLDDMPTRIIHELADEIVHQSSVVHPHIVQFLGICRILPRIHLVSEWCTRGSLFDIIKQSPKNKPFAFAVVHRIASQICIGMEYVHTRDPPIIHCYLKSRNILMDSNMTAKIGDIGVARLKAYMEVILVRNDLLSAWTAPELFEGKPSTTKVDVYSYGIILWELLTKREPYRGHEIQSIRKNVAKRKHRYKIPKNAPSEFATLIELCWAADPADRPSFTTIRRMLEEIKIL